MSHGGLGGPEGCGVGFPHALLPQPGDVVGVGPGGGDEGGGAGAVPGGLPLGFGTGLCDCTGMGLGDVHTEHEGRGLGDGAHEPVWQEGRCA